MSEQLLATAVGSMGVVSTGLVGLVIFLLKRSSSNNGNKDKGGIPANDTGEIHKKIDQHVFHCQEMRNGCHEVLLKMSKELAVNTTTVGFISKKIDNLEQIILANGRKA